MILSAIMCVAIAQAPEPAKDWHKADIAGQSVSVWGYPIERDGVRKIRWEPSEQAEARKRHPQYLTGVDPRKMASDPKQIRASDQASADYGKALLNHAAHEAGKPCPDGQKCPNKPKEPTPETRKPTALPFSQETLAAVALVVVGLFLYFRGSSGNPE